MSSDGKSISIAEWLSTRTPSPPPVLAGRLRELAGDVHCASRDLPQTLVNIATKTFDHLDDSRDSALELLAADALITYAMEAAAEFGVENAAQTAMTTIASAVAR